MLPRLIRRPLRLEYLVFWWVALACFFQLFVPPSIGVANNGDWWRIEAPEGLRPIVQPGKTEPSFGGVQFAFNRVPSIPGGYLTSERPLVRIAFWTLDLVGQKTVFQLQHLGAVHFALWLYAVAFVIAGLQYLPSIPRVIGLLVVAIAAVDPTNISWFNSLFCEAAAIIFFVASIGTVLQLAVHPSPPRILWLLFGLNWALFSISKTQHYPLFVFGFLVPIMLCSRIRGWLSWTSVVVGLLLLSSISLYCVTHIDGFTGTANRWQTVFRGVLAYSPDVENDLRDLELRQEHKWYIGQSSHGIPERDVWSITSQITHEKIALFYLTHPDRLWRVMMALAEQTTPRSGLGNFPYDEKWAQRAFAFSAWTSLKETLLPMNYGTLLGVPLLTLACAIAGWCLGPTAYRPAWGVGALLPLVALAQFGMVAVGEGTADPVKHLALFHFTWDVCVAIVAGLIVNLKRSERLPVVQRGRKVAKRRAPELVRA